MSDSPSNVAEVNFGNLRDVPSLLRTLAGQVESGEVATTRGAGCFVQQDGSLAVFGWGEVATEFEAIGILTAGAAQLATNRMTR